MDSSADTPATGRLGGMWADLVSLDPRIWVLFIIEIITTFGFGVVIPFIALYLRDEAGLSTQAVGMVMLLLVVCSSGGRIAGGELADRVGRLNVLAYGMGLRSGVLLALAACIYVRAPWLAIVGIFWVVRIFGGGIQPAITAMVSDLTTPHTRVRAFGVLRVGINAGWASGAAAGGLITHHFGYAVAFLVPAVASLVGSLIAVWGLRNVQAALAGERFSWASLVQPIRDRLMRRFCLAALPMSLLMAQLLLTLTLFSERRLGLDKTQIGLFFTLNGLLVVLLQWPVSEIVTRVSLRRALVAGCVLYVIGFGALAGAQSFTYVLICVGVISLGEVIYAPTMQSAVAHMAPAGKTGRYMGVYGLTESIGWAVGPFMGGMLLHHFEGAHAAYVWGPLAMLGVVAAVGFRAVAPAGPTGKIGSPESAS